MKSIYNKPKILILTGPTGIGKTRISLDVARKYSGEIIGADSMQIYKQMDVGTGKISKNEMNGIAHHLIDICDPDIDFSVKNFCDNAKVCASKILDNGKLPILAGGTGLYINALLNGLNLAEATKNQEIRDKYNQMYQDNGSEYVYNLLLKNDSESAMKISKNDVKRVIRALEIFESTGIPKSAIVTKNKESEYDYLVIIFIQERDKLYEKINNRVDKMFCEGFYEEAKSLYKYKNCNSMQAIGYKQIIEFMDGKIQAEDDLIQLIKQKTRNYAKRQITYFKGMQLSNKHFVDIDDEAVLYGLIDGFLGK